MLTFEVDSKPNTYICTSACTLRDKSGLLVAATVVAKYHGPGAMGELGVTPRILCTLRIDEIALYVQ